MQETQFKIKELAENTFELITVQMEQKKLKKDLFISEDLLDYKFIGDS